jgi:hypothetical protein
LRRVKGMSAFDAQRQFEDNLKNYADSPEKQNLNNGLGNIAIELQRITAALQRVEQALQRLERK